MQLPSCNKGRGSSGSPAEQCSISHPSSLFDNSRSNHKILGILAMVDWVLDCNHASWIDKLLIVNRLQLNSEFQMWI